MVKVAELKDRLETLSPTERARLLAKVQKKRESTEGTVGQSPSAGGFTYRPSHQQQYFWELHHLLRRPGTLNCRLGLKLSGNLDIPRLQRALLELTFRHDIYRTTYRETTEGLEAVVHEELLPEVIRLERNGQKPEEWPTLFVDPIQVPFDLSSKSPLRFIYWQYADDLVIAFFCFHHIACDGGTWNVFWEELRQLYLGLGGAGLPPAVDEALQYSAYAQRHESGSARSKVNETFWLRYLSELPPPKVPQTYALPEHPARKRDSNRVLLPLSPSQWNRVKTLARQWQSTQHNVFFAAFFAWHFRYAGARDIAIGTPINLRNSTDDYAVHGCTVNTLSVRASMRPDMNYRELHDAVAESMARSLEHADIPIIPLLNTIGLVEGRKYGLHKSLFQLRNIVERMAPLDEEGGSEVLIAPNKGAQLPLLCEVYPKEDSGVLSLIYDDTQYQEFEAESMLLAFRTLLDGLLKNPEILLRDLPLVDGESQQILLRDWAVHERDYPREKTVWQLFRQSAAAYAEKPALKFSGGTLSYAELQSRAVCLAAELQARGIRKGDRVCLYLERSPELIASLLAVLKIGAVYVPLDVDYPLSRIGFIIEDAEPVATLTHAACYARIRMRESAAWLYEDLISSREGFLDEDQEDVSGDDIAYLMYTSGTTGNPKGSLIPHRGIVRLVKEADYASLGPEEVFLQLASPAFDASTFEIWGPLLNGGTLALMPVETPSLRDIGEAIAGFEVSTLWLTAGLFHAVVDQAPEILEPLRQLLAGGDTLSPSHVAKLKQRQPELKLINGYGPTENTTFSCCYSIPDSFDPSLPVPIGAPIANSEAYILDALLKPLPVGVGGELFLGGDGLTAGYWKRPELNAAVLVGHPFSDTPDARLYRTGDLARYRADGNIEFLGRKDNQVKIRGFRVELAEIDRVVGDIPGVDGCCAFVRRETAGSSVLHIAVLQDKPGKDINEIRTKARERLPQYMLPEFWHSLDGLPLTAHGKVDRRQLERLAADTAKSVRKLMPPRNFIEQRLLDIWVRLFATSDIDCYDNFFDLGGNSLLAMRLLAELEREFKQKFTLGSLLKGPTISQLGDLISGAAENQSTLVPLKGNGTGRTLYLVHGWGGGILGYMNFVRNLPDTLSVYGVQAVEHSGHSKKLGSFEEMCSRYIEDILGHQSCGPFFLCGFSLGGMIAFEIARQLEARGYEVGQVLLFDTVTKNLPAKLFYRDKVPYLLKRLMYHTKHAILMPWNERKRYVADRAQALRRHFEPITNNCEIPQGKQLAEDIEVPASSDYYAVLHDRYFPRPSRLGVTVYIAQENKRNMQAIWDYFSEGNANYVAVTSSHIGMSEDEKLAKMVGQKIESLGVADNPP